MSFGLLCSCSGHRDKDNRVIKTDSAVIKYHNLASGNPRFIRRGVSTVREKHEQSGGLCVFDEGHPSALNSRHCKLLSHIYHASFRLLLWPQANGCSGDQ